MDSLALAPGTAHALMLAFMLAVIGLLLGLPRRLGEHGAALVARALAVFMLLQEAMDRVLHHTQQGDAWVEVLPFHLCGVSVVLVPVMLWTRNYALFELLYFWGLGGATVALLAPDVGTQFPDVLYVTYFTSHGLIIAGVIYAMVHFHFRPRAVSLLKATLGLFVYATAVIPLNLLLDTNYLYLCRKPASATPIDFMGPWPQYVGWMAMITIVVFMVLYAPWGMAARARSRSM
jgi:hypothetical integral membrane protein (TIGR02206 family)